MKKLILPLIAVALVVGFTACKKSFANEGKGAKVTVKTPDGRDSVIFVEYTEEDTHLGDSLARSYGQLMAVQAMQQYEQALTQIPDAQKESFTKKDFLKGVKSICAVDTADLDFILGVQTGMQLWGAAKGMPEQLMVPAEIDAMLEEFEKVFKQDSIQGSPYTYQEEFQIHLNKATAEAEAKRLKAIEETPEAKDNLAAGQAYADNLVNNEGYTRSESGLVYKVTEPGEGDKVAPNSRLKLRYVGKHINGEVFDQTEEEPMASYAGQFIKGFSEGLQLLGQGGKATIVIPAEIGYGVKGSKPKIGYNETLVFDIEVVEIL